MKTKSFLHSLLLVVACFTLLGISALHAADVAATSEGPLPRLVDLGAAKCVPCKMMKPILDELSRDYADQFETVFIDVWARREEAKRYGIRMIPTQIFYDASGRERFRHEGFYAKADILKKWDELGVKLRPPTKKE